MIKVESASDATIITRIILEQGLASPDEVNECLRSWHDVSVPAGETLQNMLVKRGVVTASQMKRVREQIEERRHVEQIPGYELSGKLGSGAMADVYRARQVSLDRDVAIKVLPKRFNEDPSFVERFYAEGRAAAKLNHPNIVQAIDVGHAGNRHYFVMEIMEGHTVYDHLRQHGRYSEPEALRIVIQIADALHHAHVKGFVHRDVKPKNIMITPEGVAKLADMGLARQVSDREAAEAEAAKGAGTPFYIRPEQIRGEKEIDGRCDIYGLGATFYHMVTGRVPFDGPNPTAVMHKHLREELVPPDHLNAKLSAGVCEIIEVTMAKDRNERYASAAVLLEDLRAVANGEPPLQARKHFTMASLANVELTGEMEKLPPPEPPPKSRVIQLMEQPLFWVAVMGWSVCVVLLLLLLMTFIRK